jgi:hypothetical protein
LIEESADDSPWACIVIAVLLCLLASRQRRLPSPHGCLADRHGHDHRPRWGQSPIHNEMGPLGPAESAKECLDRLEYIIRNRREGAVRVKDALIGLNGLTTAVVRSSVSPPALTPAFLRGK